MKVSVRAFEKNDLKQMLRIWNQVVEEGTAFPQEEPLDMSGGRTFFESQTLTAVAEFEGAIVGLYILHPNNVGRCKHIANASYAVDTARRGLQIGEKLVLDSLMRAKKLGFGVLQFNAVVKTNMPAIKLYEKLGFVQLGVIPKGFLMKNGKYEDIIPFYHTL